MKVKSTPPIIIPFEYYTTIQSIVKIFTEFLCFESSPIPFSHNIFFCPFNILLRSTIDRIFFNLIILQFFNHI